MDEPTEAILAVPFASVDMDAVAENFPEYEKDEDTGYLTNDEGSVLVCRDGYLIVAQDAATLANAEPAGKVLESMPLLKNSLVEIRLDDPALWNQSSEELANAIGEELADAFGVSDAGSKIRKLLDVAQAGAKDAERVTVDLSVDPDGTIAFIATTGLRADSPTATRLAAARPASPALFANVPERSPLYAVSGGASPEQDFPALLNALIPLFEGPAPSGNPVATAQRAAFRTLLQASGRVAGTERDAFCYLDFDPNGRFFLKGGEVIGAPVEARRDLLAALHAFVRSFPGAQGNGVRSELGEGGDSILFRFDLPAIARAIAAADSDTDCDCDDAPVNENALKFLTRLFGETFDAVNEVDSSTGASLRWCGETESVKAARALGNAAPRGRVVNPSGFLALAKRAEGSPDDLLLAGAGSYVQLFYRMLPVIRDAAGEELPEEALSALQEGIEADGEPMRLASVRGKNALSTVFVVPPNEIRFLVNLFTVAVESVQAAAAPVFYEDEDICIEEVEEDDDDEDEPAGPSAEELDEDDPGLNELED